MLKNRSAIVVLVIISMLMVNNKALANATNKRIDEIKKAVKVAGDKVSSLKPKLEKYYTYAASFVALEDTQKKIKGLIDTIKRESSANKATLSNELESLRSKSDYIAFLLGEAQENVDIFNIVKKGIQDIKLDKSISGKLKPPIIYTSDIVNDASNKLSEILKDLDKKQSEAGNDVDRELNPIKDSLDKFKARIEDNQYNKNGIKPVLNDIKDELKNLDGVPPKSTKPVKEIITPKITELVEAKVIPYIDKIEKLALDLAGDKELEKRFDNDYRADSFWGYQLSLGYEFVTIDEVFEQGFPRTGLQIYRAMVPDNSKKSNNSENDNKLGFYYGTDFFANIFLTSTAEIEKVSPTTVTTTGKTEKALLGDIQLFIPFYKSSAYYFRNLYEKKKKMEYIGLTGSVGGSMANSEEDVTGRYYGGLRFAWDRNHFLDMMIGTTEGVRGARLELRGQMPILESTLIESSKVYLGAVGNFGVTKGNGKGNDVIKIYLSWGISPEKIFSIFAPTANKAN